jgi:hypothetical protein
MDYSQIVQDCVRIPCVSVYNRCCHGEALPVTRTLCDGLPAVVSYWKPTENELAILASGGSIALWVVGASMPPIMLAVDPQ